MKITKAKLQQIIKEELSEAAAGLDPRGEEAAKEYDHLAKQISDMIPAKMERGSVMYILEQAMKYYEGRE
jgi:hypothetical protein